MMPATLEINDGSDFAGVAIRPVSRRTVACSAAVALAAGLCILSLNFVVPDGSIVRGDGLAYFMYARSIVLDRDTDLTPEFAAVDTDFPGTPYGKVSLHEYSRRVPATGKIAVPWPIGAGIVMAPFYAMGYAAESIVAFIQARPPNAFGVIPQYFFGLGSVLFGLLAFWTAVACCQHVANVKSAYLSSAVTLLAGPAVFYMFFSPAMAHAPSLGLAGVLTWLWLRCWNGRSQGLFWLGLLVGTLICIRYQNAIFGIMVIALVARDARRHGFALACRESATAAAGALIPLALQVNHYIEMNGWSLGGAEGAAAGAAGSGFMLLNHANVGVPRLSQFADLLLSCDKGAFYWAPALAVGCAGLLYAAWHHGWARVVLATVVANILLISTITNDAGTLDMRMSFGMRYLTECSIACAMGMAALIAQARSSRAWRVWVGVGTALIIWNMLLILAYVLTIPRSGCVPYPEMASGMTQAVVKVVSMIGGR